MAKWKKNQTKFSVTIFYDNRRGSMINIPKPVLEQLGEPSEIVFEIKKSGNVTIGVDDKK